MPHTILKKIHDFVDSFKSDEFNKDVVEDEIIKSIVSRCCPSDFFAIKDGNVLLLGEYLPPDTVDEIVETNGKFVLLVAKGEYSWSANINIENVDDNVTAAEVQNKAISLVEENKNSVQYVVVCRGVNKTFAGRPLYQAFAQYTYVRKEENEPFTMENNSIVNIIKVYDTVDDLPAAVRKLTPKKQRQFLHVWNSAYAKDKDETSAFKQAWGTVNKSEDVIINDNGGEVELEKSAVIDHFIPISKGNFVQGLVYGVVYEPMQKDSHGDWSTAEEIEKMANSFLPSALRNGVWTDKNHKEKIEMHDVEIAQSYIAPCDFEFPNNEKVIKGSWVLVSKVNSEALRKEIESGEVTGYSLEGIGRRIDKDL